MNAKPDARPVPEATSLAVNHLVQGAAWRHLEAAVDRLMREVMGLAEEGRPLAPAEWQARLELLVQQFVLVSARAPLTGAATSVQAAQS